MNDTRAHSNYEGSSGITTAVVPFLLERGRRESWPNATLSTRTPSPKSSGGGIGLREEGQHPP